MTLTDQDEAMLTGVRQWLEGGGYVLEMRVARALARLRMPVDQGYVYTDVDTGKEREGDISAMVDADTLDDYWHMLDLVIECKSTTAPWVGFKGGSGGNGPWTAGSAMDYRCPLCRAMVYRFADLRNTADEVYAITEKRSRGARDHAYEAVQQAASATLGRYGAGPRWEGHGDKSIITTLAVPIVVTTSQLFVCALDDAGEISLKAVDRLNVTVPRVNVPEPGSDGLEILVVRESAFDSMVVQLGGLVDGWRDEVAPLT